MKCPCCKKKIARLGHLSDVCEPCYFRCTTGPICDRFTRAGRKREEGDEAAGARMHAEYKRRI